MVDIDDRTGTERARCEENEASLAGEDSSIMRFAVSKSNGSAAGVIGFISYIDTYYQTVFAEGNCLKCFKVLS